MCLQEVWQNKNNDHHRFNSHNVRHTVATNSPIIIHHDQKYMQRHTLVGCDFTHFTGFHTPTKSDRSQNKTLHFCCYNYRRQVDRLPYVQSIRVAVDDTTNIIIIPERKHSDPNEMRFSSGFPSLSISLHFFFHLFCSIFISKVKREKAVTVMRFVRISYVAGCWAGFFLWLAGWLASSLLTFLPHCMRFVLCTHISTNFRVVFVRATS